MSDLSDVVPPPAPICAMAKAGSTIPKKVAKIMIQINPDLSLSLFMFYPEYVCLGGLKTFLFAKSN
jgi:hypothetical protein